MKKYKFLTIVPILLFMLSCSDNEKEGPQDQIRPMKIEGSQLALGDNFDEGTVITRAVSEFSVNKSATDPTYNLSSRTNWTLDITVYYNNVPYVDGQSLYIWNAAQNLWIPEDPVYFPNYRTQVVSAKMTPPNWSTISPCRTAPNFFLTRTYLRRTATIQ